MGPEMPKRRWKLQFFQLSGQLLEFFRLYTFQIISCHDCWPLTKPGYISMTQRQSNNQWSGVIAAHTKMPQKIPNTKIWWKSSLLDFCNQDGILQLIIFQRAKLSEPRITYLCWCNWRKFWRKNSTGISQYFLVLHYIAPAHRAVASLKELTYLNPQCFDHPPSYPHLASRTAAFSPDWNNNWILAIFCPPGRSLLPRRPGWMDNFTNYFWVPWRS